MAIASPRRLPPYRVPQNPLLGGIVPPAQPAPAQFAPSGALVGDARKAELRGLLSPAFGGQPSPVMNVPNLPAPPGAPQASPIMNAPNLPAPPGAPQASPLQNVTQPMNYGFNLVPNSPLQSNAPQFGGSPLVDAYQQSASIYNSAQQIDALRLRSQGRFPMAPNSPLQPYTDPDAESARRLAPILARDQAAQQNRRTPLPQSTPGQDFARTLPVDPAGMANRSVNNQFRMSPGGAQMQDRFGAGSPLTRSNVYSDPEQYRRVAEREYKENDGVWGGKGGTMPEYAPTDAALSRAAESQKSLRAQQQQKRDSYSGPEGQGEEAYRKMVHERALQYAKDRADPTTAVGAARAKALASRDARREKSSDLALRRMIARGGNLQQLKKTRPEAYARMERTLKGEQAPQNPLLTRDSTRTPRSLADADAVVDGVMNGVPGPPDKDGNPTMAAPPSRLSGSLKEAGYDPKNDDSMSVPHSVVAGLFEQGTTPEPDDVRALRALAVASREKRKGTANEANPFGDIVGGQQADQGLGGIPQHVADALPKLYDELADMPDNASDSQLHEWTRKLYSVMQSPAPAGPPVPQTPYAAPGGNSPSNGYGYNPYGPR